MLIVPTTQPEDIEQFGIRVAEAWKLGRKGVDDGAILIVAKNDRRVRIEVGYGLEGALPDAIASRIVAETITPHFKLGDFDGGVEAGVDQMISVVNGEPLPEPDKKWERHGGLGNMLPLLLVVVFVASGVLRAMFGRLFGSIATGGLAGGLAWLLSHLLPIGIGAGVIAFLFAMLAGSSSRGWSTGSGWGGGLGWRWFRWRRLRRWGRGWIQWRRRRLRWRRRLGKLVMRFGRMLRHATATHWRTRMLFPKTSLDAIEQAIARAESTHGGEIRFAIETALTPAHIWHDLGPRVHALEVFSQTCGYGIPSATTAF